MQRALAAIVVAIAVAGSAAAGDAANPEVTDPAQDAGAGNAWGDVTAAWANDTATDFVVTLQIALLPPAPPQNYVYYFAANLGEGDNASYGCYAFLFAGSPTYGCSAWDGGPVGEPLDGTGSLNPGQPGTVVLNLPRAAVGDPSAGTVVSGLNVGSGLAVGAPVPVPVPGTFNSDDVAQASRDYILANGAPAPTGGPSTQGNGTAGNTTGQGNTTAPPAPAPTPGFEPVLVATGAAVVAVLARRRRA